MISRQKNSRGSGSQNIAACFCVKGRASSLHSALITVPGLLPWWFVQWRFFTPAFLWLVPRVKMLLGRKQGIPHILGNVNFYNGVCKCTPLLYFLSDKIGVHIFSHLMFHMYFSIVLQSIKSSYKCSLFSRYPNQSFVPVSNVFYLF